MAKKKSKLKKILGGVAAAATAAALMRGKDKGAVTADVPRSQIRMDNRMIPGATSAETKGIREIADRGTIDEKDYDIYGNKKSFKKGGRVGVGIAKRGFGRAMKGRK
jgi:hypothetical protein